LVPQLPLEKKTRTTGLRAGGLCEKQSPFLWWRDPKSPAAAVPVALVFQFFDSDWREKLLIIFYFVESFRSTKEVLFLSWRCVSTRDFVLC
jgi:hypothetical protein